MTRGRMHPNITSSRFFVSGAMSICWCAMSGRRAGAGEWHNFGRVPCQGACVIFLVLCLCAMCSGERVAWGSSD